MTKAEIMILIQQAWDDFNSLLDGLSDAQKSTPDPKDGWTVKDVLAHIAIWERSLGTWLAAANSGHEPDVPRFTDEYINEMNARIYEEHREQPYRQVYEMFRGIHRSFLMPHLEVLPEDNDDPRWLLWRDGRPPWTLIAGNTYEHYKEHAEAIRRYLL
jgi:uncharacterized protein (TIGR03083 family)